MTDMFWNPITKRFEPGEDDNMMLYRNPLSDILNRINTNYQPTIMTPDLIEAKRQVELARIEADVHRINSEEYTELTKIKAEQEAAFVRDCVDTVKTWLITRKDNEKQLIASMHERGLFFMKEKLRFTITIK